MRDKNIIIANRLLNLFRQAHVIFGGWSAVNRVFVKESNEQVLEELKKLPTGTLLVKHIKNLFNGITPMDSIDSELLPYGNLMSDNITPAFLSDKDIEELTNLLKNFIPTKEYLDKIKSLNFIQNLGEDWVSSIESALSGNKNLDLKWADVKKTYLAYKLWDRAVNLINNELTEHIKAQIQADMIEYETYLPLFGESGTKLLSKLRNITI